MEETMEYLLIRSNDGKHNYGKFYADSVMLGHTLEDTDRYLEAGGIKIDGDTAIPRGRYRISITYSNRFKRPMPEIHGVPNYTGVRIHGGNDEHDTLGCPLLGSKRVPGGIQDCAGPNHDLMASLEAAAGRGEESWITVE